MFDPRQSGILLHPTSLPGRYGIGEIGPRARAFAASLGAMGQGLWQVLPLGPTGYADSPYQSLSSFAGNPLLISLEQLHQDGLWTPAPSDAFSSGSPGLVDFGALIPIRDQALGAVCRGFSRRASPEHRAAYQTFRRTQAHWLDDFALFMAIKRDQGLRPWTAWPAPLRDRESSALRDVRRSLRTPIRHIKLGQYLFFDQWRRLRSACRRHGVRLVGDLPIFVAHDSADVWANPDLFHLTEDGQPTVVAGVPPDYFSDTGQRWGNPLYRWDRHRASGYAWWIRRLQGSLDLVDVIRIDHFRGFEAFWEIPAAEPTAIRGRWVKGPGIDLFRALRVELGTLPIIAEDLGLITPEVDALREACGFPGMRVLQFGFDGKPGDPLHWPESFPTDCVCYTGTHDNDTTRGWFDSLHRPGPDHAKSRKLRKRLLAYLGTSGVDIHWDLIRTAAESPAATVIIPLQDVLGLDSSARMNTPGTTGGNWRWRLDENQLTESVQRKLHDLTRQAGRNPTN